VKSKKLGVAGPCVVLVVVLVGVVLVVVELGDVVVGAPVVLVVVVGADVVVVVGAWQAVGSQVPAPMFVPPASVQSDGLSSRHSSATP
jgi:hypothetical protein